MAEKVADSITSKTTVEHPYPGSAGVTIMVKFESAGDLDFWVSPDGTVEIEDKTTWSSDTKKLITGNPKSLIFEPRNGAQVSIWIHRADMGIDQY